MARLPQPGSDQGQWGGILNEFLSVSHQSNGALKPVAEGSLDSSVQNKLNNVGSSVADGSITTVKLNDEAVTNAKVSTSAAIDQSKISGLTASLSGKVGTDGPAAASGAVFWGVWQEGNDPTPPNDGKVHWGFKVI